MKCRERGEGRMKRRKEKIGHNSKVKEINADLQWEL